MKSAPRLRTLLVLGRMADLPTVWSNALAGWLLGGGGNFWKLPFLLLGLTALYTGGAFLNDAFDADSDRQRRPERPVPSGKISAQLVWRAGFGQLVAGIFLLLFCSQLSAGAAILLALFILLYNFCHQFFNAAPWLLGVCRFWNYVIASAAGVWGLNGWPILCGLALAFYTAGLGYTCQRKSNQTLIPRWPIGLLGAPILLALTMNAGGFRLRAMWISVAVLAWLVACLRKIFLGGGGNPGLISANLLAGMVLMDWLAVAPQMALGVSALIFVALLGLTKWLQKTAPAS